MLGPYIANSKGKPKKRKQHFNIFLLTIFTFLIILYTILYINRPLAKMTNKRVFCEKKNALIHELGHFMTVLKKLPFSLVYYFHGK